MWTHELLLQVIYVVMLVDQAVSSLPNGDCTIFADLLVPLTEETMDVELWTLSVILVSGLSVFPRPVVRSIHLGTLVAHN